MTGLPPAADLPTIAAGPGADPDEELAGTRAEIQGLPAAVVVP